MGSYALDKVTVVFDDVDRGPSLGSVFELDGKEYRFVKISDTDSVTETNIPVVFLGTDPSSNDWEVSPDVSDAEGLEFFAGLTVVAADTGQYCYVLREGPATIEIDEAVTNAGDAIVVSDDGKFGAAGATDYPNGLVLEGNTEAATGVPAWIKAI